MESNTVLLVVVGVFLLWLAASNRLKNVNPAWKVLLTGSAT